MKIIQLAGDALPDFLERQIDEAVGLDFQVEKLNDHDFDNENYRSMRYSLEFSGVTILYERKVISNKAPIVPHTQYLFGFSPVEGLCIFTKNKMHKEILCNGKLFEMFRQTTSFIHSLQYLLVEPDVFNVWSYLPLVPDNEDTMEETLNIDLRIKLFTNIKSK